MKGEDFAAIRVALGHTQVEFAKLLGVTSTSISNYELGHVPIPKMLYLLLTAVKQKKVTLK
jgi:transcriptional regulator with XRE-family HTH domain